MNSGKSPTYCMACQRGRKKDNRHGSLCTTCFSTNCSCGRKNRDDQERRRIRLIKIWSIILKTKFM